MPTFGDRLIHAWNAFTGRDPTYTVQQGPGYAYRPDRVLLKRGNERSIVNSIFNRIAVDCASISVEHVKLDENDRFIENVDSDLNYCLTTEANIDQTGRALIQDIVMSMLDEGSVAIVPVETSVSPISNDAFKIKQIRTGKIVNWYSETVRIRLYNEKKCATDEIVLPKKAVAIVENPFYAVMNEPNSVLQRLIRKLNLLDVVDEQTSSGKLDLIIQLPYIVKSEARRQQAEHRRKEIEMQLTGSKYGIAYTDGTERITQLNRAVENNLMNQIEYLTSMLYSQLGISKEVLDGTAKEEVMNAYYTRIVEPILSAIVDEMKRKFLTKTARSQLQSIAFFRDPFKLVPTTQLADLTDKFTRNEVMTSNEIRQIVGMKPAKDPNADMLRNKNISQSGEAPAFDVNGQPIEQPGMSDPNAQQEGMPAEAAPQEQQLMQQPAEQPMVEQPQTEDVAEEVPEGEEEMSQEDEDIMKAIYESIAKGLRSQS